MNGELDSLLPEFLAEAKDILERVNADLDQLPKVTEQSELLDALYRNIHTIKGSSAMFGMEDVKKISHSLESFLSEAKQRKENFGEKEITKIRKVVQHIESLLVEKKKPITPVQTGLNDTVAQDHRPSQVVEEYIRVPASKLNITLNSVSEIFTIRNQMVYLIERFKAGDYDNREFFQNWDLLDNAMRRGIGELERSTVAMRMMSVDGLFTRLGRIVQTYLQDSSKKIHFETLGKETELDKAVLDSLSEPLVHMVRNAMDHGIELPADRLASGKTEIGKISISASVTGNEVVISLRDDGRGMNGEKILESAKKKGIDTSWVAGPNAALDLIFLPGFSTAEKVTDVSGRGVGMDVVKTSIQKLGGRISISTEIGKGTEFLIRLPVSMSLVASVLFEINGYKYAVPNHEIIETRRVPIEAVKHEGGRKFAMFRDKFVPVMETEQFFVSRSLWSKTECKKEIVLLFFEMHGKYFAAEVSHLEKNTELVVRRPQGSWPSLSYISGVSVLPTGEPLFVISLIRLFEIEKTGALHAAA